MAAPGPGAAVGVVQDRKDAGQCSDLQHLQTGHGTRRREHRALLPPGSKPPPLPGRQPAEQGESQHRGNSFWANAWVRGGIHCPRSCTRTRCPGAFEERASDTPDVGLLALVMTVCDTIRRSSAQAANQPPGRCRAGEGLAWRHSLTGRLFRFQQRVQATGLSIPQRAATAGLSFLLLLVLLSPPKSNATISDIFSPAAPCERNSRGNCGLGRMPQQNNNSLFCGSRRGKGRASLAGGTLSRNCSLPPPY